VLSGLVDHSYNLHKPDYESYLQFFQQELTRVGVTQQKLNEIEVPRNFKLNIDTLEVERAGFEKLNKDPEIKVEGDLAERIKLKDQLHGKLDEIRTCNYLKNMLYEGA